MGKPLWAQDSRKISSEEGLRGRKIWRGKWASPRVSHRKAWSMVHLALLKGTVGFGICFLMVDVGGRYLAQFCNSLQWIRETPATASKFNVQQGRNIHYVSEPNKMIYNYT
ncbi:hypothetical protein PVK06_023783 [Gossypium arboreum]|uniref:Uncharacterized protein n=1 Tax=Gossypium arboreum TaxID=29729 RepID=A0ABR0PC93_GOSAR|nr:hypothetical protein PVK06_023783 [Gossypium arboreum]